MSAPESARSTVVAHELEHIAAHDQAAIVAAQLIAILLPWNLPLWWFVKRLRAAIEIDCDARVVRGGVDPAHYAEVLLAVGQRGVPSPYAAATLIEPVTHLEQRIRIMLAQRPRSVTRAAIAAILTVALAACATQLEPPVLMGSSLPAAPAPPPLIKAEGDVVKLFDVSSETGAFTMHAPRIVMTLTDPAQMQATAERVDVDEGDGEVLLEGNLRLELDRTLITATRALAKKQPDGSTTWQIDDAQVVRSGAAAPTPSGE